MRKSVAFSAGGDGGRKAPEPPAQPLAIYEYPWRLPSLVHKKPSLVSHLGVAKSLTTMTLQKRNWSI